MPVYYHECQNTECLHAWEDQYSIKLDPPKICPKCNQETAKRMISMTANPIVELSGDDLVKKVKGDANQMRRDMHKSENLYSNLLGPDRYQSMQTKMDKRGK